MNTGSIQARQKRPPRSRPCRAYCLSPRHNLGHTNHGNNNTGKSGRYHQIGRRCAKDSTMRLAVCPQKIALRYSSPPAMPAGIAHAKAIAAPSTTAASTPTSQCSQRKPGLHQGASTTTGKSWSKMTGPLANTPNPMANPNSAKPRLALPSAARSVPCMPIKTKNASITSNMAEVEKIVHNRQLTNTTTACPPTSERSGQRRFASPKVSSIPPAENSGDTKRGHHSLTPSTAQPA